MNIGPITPHHPSLWFDHLFAGEFLTRSSELMTDEPKYNKRELEESSQKQSEENKSSRGRKSTCNFSFSLVTKRWGSERKFEMEKRTERWFTRET